MSYKEPILITGAARSGTSMTAGVINLCGAWGGNLAGPTSNNRKGMFENTEIRNGLVKPYLRKFGWDPLGQNPLPPANKIKLPLNWKKQVLSVMKEQGLKPDIDWFYKGAKMCLMWPVWHVAFPDAKWIIVRRNKMEIINSCLRTSFMRAYKTEEGWGHWVDAHMERFESMSMFGLYIKEVWPSKMIKGDFSEIKEVVQWLGLEWNEEKVRSFIEPALWNKKRK